MPPQIADRAIDARDDEALCLKKCFDIIENGDDIRLCSFADILTPLSHPSIMID
jgi:hypothetical protein